MTQPKKTRKPKSKKINVNSRRNWEQILKSVPKDEVPVEMLESLLINLIDGTIVQVNIAELIREGKRPTDIEEHINNKLQELNDMIVDVDFFISIDKVSEIISPMTNNVLKHI